MMLGIREGNGRTETLLARTDAAALKGRERKRNNNELTQGYSASERVHM